MQESLCDNDSFPHKVNKVLRLAVHPLPIVGTLPWLHQTTPFPLSQALSFRRSLCVDVGLSAEQWASGSMSHTLKRHYSCYTWAMWNDFGPSSPFVGLFYEHYNSPGYSPLVLLFTHCNITLGMSKSVSQ